MAYYDKIKCPYCFGREFSHTEVHFRLETVSDTMVSDEDIANAYDLKEKEELQRQRMFQSREDEKYTKFWEDFGGVTTEKSTSNERKEYGCEVYELPVIDPNTADGQKCLKLQHHTDGRSDDYFVYDGTGMVQGVVDVYGHESYRRVCPHCHNPLPRGYGKNDVKFISVIGIRGAGKTVFISQLLRNIEVSMWRLIKFNAYKWGNRVDNFLHDNPVKKGVQLPDSTMQGRFAQPLAYDIVKADTGDIKTLIIYDIAGEDCVATGGMDRYGKFVLNSDGILLLVSPRQIGIRETMEIDSSLENSQTQSDEDEDVAPPVTVLNTIYQEVLTKQLTDPNEKCDIPIAVCISKSDFFADDLGIGDDNRDEIRRIISSDLQPYEDPRTGDKKYLFNASEYNVIEKKIRDRMVDDPIHGALQQYKHFNYFAFSAIGCNVRKSVVDGAVVSSPVSDPSPKRIMEPVLWLLKRFGLIRSNTPIRLPEMRGDPNRKVPIPRSFIEKLMGKPDYRELKPEEIEALWYEERC